MDDWKRSVLLLTACVAAVAATGETIIPRWLVIGVGVVTPGYATVVVFGRSAPGFVGAVLVASTALWVLTAGPPSAVTSYLLGGLAGITVFDVGRRSRDL